VTGFENIQACMRESFAQNRRVSGEESADGPPCDVERLPLLKDFLAHGTHVYVGVPSRRTSRYR
jgi:hypothetical protein